jgi:hypothetical protein
MTQPCEVLYGSRQFQKRLAALKEQALPFAL